MASVLDPIMQSLTPAEIKQYAQEFDLDAARVTDTFGLAVALILAALEKRAAVQDGAAEILRSLTPPKDKPLDAASNETSAVWLNEWFGVGMVKVVNWLQDTTELNVMPFLPLAAQRVMRALQERAQAEPFDAAGLAALLKSETDVYAHTHPQLASEINAALALGETANERAARIRAQFADDEWDTVAKTPILASYAVMMSALSGPVGINKEIDALLDALEEFGHQAEPDSLVGLVSHTYNTPDAITSLGANRANALNLARDACLETLRILTEKETYDEKLAYKEFVMNVATRVASAAKDGGILGIGGTPISSEEQLTLDMLAAALAYQP